MVFFYIQSISFYITLENSDVKALKVHTVLRALLSGKINVFKIFTLQDFLQHKFNAVFDGDGQKWPLLRCGHLLLPLKFLPFIRAKALFRLFIQAAGLFLFRWAKAFFAYLHRPFKAVAAAHPPIYKLQARRGGVFINRPLVILTVFLFNAAVNSSLLRLCLPAVPFTFSNFSQRYPPLCKHRPRPLSAQRRAVLCKTSFL
ncbi:MAG: hypothetical protein Q4G07_02165 [Oscillospiraceae bacterium]|nr:hypothetical protein [Oscillospiraceae bacterium]